MTSDLTTGLLSDYYIIAIMLFDLKFRKVTFWKEFLTYFDFLRDPQHVDNMKMIVNKLNEEIPDLR
jgi:hypothetical protein